MVLDELVRAIAHDRATKARERHRNAIRLGPLDPPGKKRRYIDDRAFPKEWDYTFPRKNARITNPFIPPDSTVNGPGEPLPVNSSGMGTRPEAAGAAAMDIVTTGTGGGSSCASTIPGGIAHPHIHAPTSGYGGPGSAGLVAGTNRSTAGARCHQLMSHLDEYKSKGRKRARGSTARLFEAATPWIPFRMLEVCSQLTEPPVTHYNSTTPIACQGHLIARSRSTYSCMLIADASQACANCFETTDVDFQKNGLFASTPALSGVLGQTPGKRESGEPHIGKLTLNGSVIVSWWTPGIVNPATPNEVKISTSVIQLHLVRVSNTYARTTFVGTTAVNNGLFAKALDASDFDIGSGSESFLNGQIMTEQRTLAPFGTNQLVAQEDELYPPRQKYKIVWSSPMITTARAQHGNQTGTQAAATANATDFYCPRIDISNIEIDIDRTISFDTHQGAIGAEVITANLASIPTNMGDPFDCYHLIITAHPVVTPYLATERDGDKVLKLYDTVVVPLFTYQISYTYNFKENDN